MANLTRTDRAVCERLFHGCGTDPQPGRPCRLRTLVENVGSQGLATSITCRWTRCPETIPASEVDCGAGQDAGLNPAHIDVL